MKKIWLDPDLTEAEYRFILFNWWDALPPQERSPELIKALVLAGLDIDGIVSDKQ